MSKKKKVITIISSILILIICIGGVVIYKNIKINKQIEEFNIYVDEAKTEMAYYIIEDNKEKYDELIEMAEKIINNKNIKKITSFKKEFNTLKEDIIKNNEELLNTAINEVEGIDISNLEDKELIQQQIEEIINIKKENKFIEAMELVEIVKEDINNKLEIIRIEEEKKRAEEEAKRIAEEEAKLINNIYGSYTYITDEERIDINISQYDSENIKVYIHTLYNYVYSDGTPGSRSAQYEVLLRKNNNIWESYEGSHLLGEPIYIKLEIIENYVELVMGSNNYILQKE